MRALGWFRGDFEVALGAMGGLQEGPGRGRGGHDVAISLSGEHLGSVMQKCTPDLHHRMKCDYGDVLGVRKCASGECPKHILIFEQIHEFRILDVYNGQSDTRVLRDEKSIVFVVRDFENHLFSRCVFRPLFTKPMK